MTCISSAEIARGLHPAALLTSEHADEGEDGLDGSLGCPLKINLKTSENIKS